MNSKRVEQMADIIDEYLGDNSGYEIDPGYILEMIQEYYGDADIIDGCPIDEYNAIGAMLAGYAVDSPGWLLSDCVILNNLFPKTFNIELKDGKWRVKNG